MKTRYLILLGLVPVAAGAVVLARRRQAPAQPAPSPAAGATVAPPAALPSPSPAPLGAAIVSPPPAPAGVVAPPVQGKDILTKAVQVVSGGGAAAIVGAGLKLQELEAKLVGAVGGNQATQDATKVFGHMGLLGFGAQQGAKELLKAVGADANTQKHVSQVAGVGAVAAAVFGAPVLVGVGAAKLAAEGVSAAIGLVAGKEAEKDVRNAVSQLDPFKTGSAAHTVVKGVADVIFGPSTPAPAPVGLVSDVSANKGAGQVKNDADRAVLATRAAATQAAKSGGGGIVNRRLIEEL